jgi:uncharacterized protein YfaP (DUF2135 family)
MRNIVIVVALIAILVIPVVLFYSGLLGSLINTNPYPTPSHYTSAPPSTPYSPIPTSTGTSPTSTPTTPLTNNKVTITKGQNVQVATQSIGATGGTIEAGNTSPLNRLKIKVPQAAVQDPVTIQISYADINTITGLPQGASVKSKLITVTTSGSSTWNQYKLFDKPVEVTFPYDASAANSDENPVRFYWYDEQTGKLDSAGFFSQDKNAKTITFLTSSFSSFLAIEINIQIANVLNTDYSVDTGFRPTIDGWFIPNYGSYLESGGNCLGMVSYAKWYYSYAKGTAVDLYENYREGNPNEWRDDSTAIQLATRCQAGNTGIWGSLTTEERNWATANAREVAVSWIHGMVVTGEPQLVGLKTPYNNGTMAAGGHAVLTYEYSQGMFEIYDPNFPGTSLGDSMREIPFTYENGFSEIYVSGLTRNDNLKFNIFYHAGSKMAATPDAYSGLYESAKSKFNDDSIFPTVTLTDINSDPEGTTPVDTDGDGVRDTTASTAVISGTITGGQQPISSTLIFVSNQKYIATVENGVFSQEVPLYNGANDLVILATDANTFTNWAGFLRDTIDCSASIASLTVTLTWDQGESDVDLHVLEPGTSGRHIYYNDKGSSYDNMPYLDLDNTHGYGPEHYYATESMTLPGQDSLYGQYHIRVHYYADHDDDDESVQPITWHLNVKYLAFKDPVTGQEFWFEETRTGILSSASSSDTSDFNNVDSSWSNIWTIDYQAPNASNYGIPPPPQNQFL